MFTVRDSKLINFLEDELSRDEAYKLITSYPEILPFVGNNRYLLIKDFSFKDVSSHIALFVRRNNKILPYLLDFSLYAYGDLIDEEYYPPAEALWDVGLMSDELDWMIKNLGYEIKRSRSKYAKELKEKLRNVLKLKRLEFGETELVYIVNDITEDFKSFIDLMNEEHETYISGLALRKYIEPSSNYTVYILLRYPE